MNAQIITTQPIIRPAFTEADCDFDDWWDENIVKLAGYYDALRSCEGEGFLAFARCQFDAQQRIDRANEREPVFVMDDGWFDEGEGA